MRGGAATRVRRTASWGSRLRHSMGGTDAQRPRDVSAISATTDSATSASLPRLPMTLGRGRRGLRRAREDDGTPGTRRRSADTPHGRGRRREPRRRPQDLMLGAPSERERHSAVIVPCRRPSLGPCDSGARVTARRRCSIVRERGDVGHLTVLGAAHVSHAGLVPRQRELGESDRGDQRRGEQPGRDRPPQGLRETVTICTPAHSRPISNYAAVASLSRSERALG
jgi:hypothetical protein